MPPKTRTQHQTPSERLADVALALANRRTEPRQTVILTRNAKGEVQFSVEVTDEDVKLCGKLAEAEFKRLDRVFPLSQAQKAAQRAA